MVPVKGRAPLPAMAVGVVNSQEFTPKTLIKRGACNGTQSQAFVLTRSAQFSLSSSYKSRPPGKGGLAQLVERLLCKQNVNGSNPLTSTKRLSAQFEI